MSGNTLAALMLMQSASAPHSIHSSLDEHAPSSNTSQTAASAGLDQPRSDRKLYSTVSDLFCVDGKQIPSVFLLGSQKCSTSSLAAQLLTEGRLRGPKSPLAHKEAHYFDHNHSSNILAWAARFHDGCGSSMVAFDGTPNYVLIYARRQGALAAIKNMYGAERLRHTTFVMILCDPVQRAQSFEWHLGCQSCFSSRAANPQDTFPSFEGGKYGEQVNAILATLGHITLIPAVLYWSHADLVMTELVNDIERRGGKRPKGKTFSSKPPKVNDSPHPKLDSEVDALISGPKLAQYYMESNQYVYDKVYRGDDPRVTVVPPLEKWPADTPKHFLEISAPLKGNGLTSVRSQARLGSV